MPKRSTHPGGFPETDQKDILRAKDGILLQSLSSEKARKLVYLGLAGINAFDVLKWRDYLDQVIVVERPIREEELRNDFRTRIALTLNPHFNGNFRLVFSDIWDLLASPDLQKLERFPDVINLDFCGGLLNVISMEYPKQRLAFQRMFEAAQVASHDFILMLTLMPRDKGKVTYKKYLADNVNAIGKPVRNEDVLKTIEAIQRFHERDNLTLFKACLPILISEIGRSHNYVVRVKYIKLYTKMIHLVFSCRFVKGILGLPNDQASLAQILNLPLRKLMVDGTEQYEWPPQVTLDER